MTPRGPRPGDVYIATFPEHDPRGHEQEGLRPAVVPAVPPKARFPVLLVAPLTTDRGQPWVLAAPDLYPRLPKGTAGLPGDSTVLLDQARSIDASRIRRWMGTLNEAAYGAVSEPWLALFR